MEIKPLVIIVGPTASGKTSLAVDLAEQFGGEIICVDSRTVYREMNIGTAKPSLDDQERVPHWGIDLVSPDERFSAADFKSYAIEKIADIRSRNRIPFLVGGTGLYIDSIVFDYEFGDRADEKQRAVFEKMSLDELYDYCNKNNVPLPENHKNKRYVIRAIEQKSINTKRRMEPIENTLIVGIATEPTILRTRIEYRSEQLFENGVVNEAKMLGEKYGWSHQSMTGNIYLVCHKYLLDELTLEQAKQKTLAQDWRLAKRQLTWLRRNPFIQWLPLNDAKHHLQSVLASEH
ncbi:MAG: putative tRNA dimethylallyltransferase [Candidatus Saccharibacteria bacterium]|nr:putative tRNA dimethylallyltransferase [Candidatus Saccharibacteria bacterium]